MPFLLVLIEVFVPLIGPYLEELLVHGKVNLISFLNFNLPFVFSPVVSIPLSISFAQLYFSRNHKEPPQSLSILNLDNIASDTLTLRIWMFTQTIYTLACTGHALTNLNQIRQDDALNKHYKKI